MPIRGQDFPDKKRAKTVSLSYTSNPFEYADTRDTILRFAENQSLALKAETDPANAISKIHDDNGTENGGSLTIGYGLNLDNDALSADNIVDAIEYALTGTISPAADALTAAQQAGLLLLHEWKSGAYSDAYMLDLVSSEYDPTRHSKAQQAHHACLESLSLTDEQATRLLHASIWA